MITRATTVNFIQDLARRNVSIGHKMNDVREDQRFFQWASKDALRHNYSINNTGWNLILDMPPGKIEDNRADTEWKRPRIALDFVKLVKPDDQAGENTTLDQAEALGWEFLRRMREIARNPCLAITNGLISNGITPPSAVLWPTIRYVELAPLIFIGDRLFGFRFEVDLRYEVQNIDSSAPAWGAPA